jgi:ribonuclease III
MTDLTAFFETFNIVPNDKRLYQYALTHRSYVHQHKKNKKEDQQERLEFFGDAVLKFIVSYYLMHKFPKMEEGKLTKIRARIISDRSLASVALVLNLDRFVFISDSEKAFDGHQRPSLLSDTFEAILGALYLDKGIDYTLDWMQHIIEDNMVEYLDLDVIVDYKTFLQEQVQKYGSKLPLYECVKMTGPEHKKVFHFSVSVKLNGQDIEAKGEGENKKIAQQAAAKACVDILTEKKLIQ